MLPVSHHCFTDTVTDTVTDSRPVNHRTTSRDKQAFTLTPTVTVLSCQSTLCVCGREEPGEKNNRELRTGRPLPLESNPQHYLKQVLKLTVLLHRPCPAQVTIKGNQSVDWSQQCCTSTLSLFKAWRQRVGCTGVVAAVTPFNLIKIDIKSINDFIYFMLQSKAQHLQRTVFSACFYMI